MRIVRTTRPKKEKETLGVLSHYLKRNHGLTSGGEPERPRLGKWKLREGKKRKELYTYTANLTKPKPYSTERTGISHNLKRISKES